MAIHKLSVVVITFNEEEVIGACLKSVQSIADEIIVVDSFSTDDTKAECLKFKARFVERKWTGYSATKNFAIGLATNSLILSLDADEQLDEEAIQAIQKVKNQNQLVDGFSINRKNFYQDTWIRFCGWYPDAKIRLFQKGKAEWVGNYVHETLQLKDNKSVNHLDGNILHYTVKSHKHHRQTVHKYAKLAAEQAKKSGQKVMFLPTIFSFAGRFIKIYFLKLGFLHGIIGFRIAIQSSCSKWLKYQYYHGLL